MITRGAAALVGCCALVGVSLAAQSGPPRQARDEQPLAKGVSLTREIRASETHHFTLQLHARDFVAITIRQHGIDVRATLLRPDGTTLLAVDARSNLFHAESVVAIGDVDGPHTLAIAPVSASAAGGPYTIDVEELRPAEPLDERRVEAERAYERARELVKANDAAAFRQAIGPLDDALLRFRELRNEPGELKALLELATVERQLGRREGLETAGRAVGLARSLADEPSVALATYSLGRMQEYVGDLAAALRSYEQVGAIVHAIGDRRGEAMALNAQGIVHGRTGDGERALTLFEGALALARASGDDVAHAMILNNLGIAYKNVGEYERSFDMYEESLAIARRSNDLVSQSFVLTNMGNLQERLARYDLAMDFQSQALAAARTAGQTESEARALNAIGRLQAKQGAHADALRSHRAALEIRRRIADLAGQAASLDGEGRALHAHGDDAAAVKSLEEALTLRRRLSDLLGEGDTLQALAVIARDRSEFEKAAEYISAAIDCDETIRSRLTSPQLRTSFVAAEHDKYDFYIDVRQRQHAADPGGGHAAEALEVSERARARVLLESMLAGSVDLRQGVEPALLDRERALQVQLRDASAQLARVQGAGASPAAVSAAERLERLSADYQQLQAEIRRRSPRYATLTQPRPLPVPEIQRDVLDDRTVLLEFALGEERGWVWAVTPTSIWSGSLPDRATIEKAARALYEELTARQSRPRETAEQYAARVERADRAARTDAAVLSRMLLGGVAARLQGEWAGKRLAIVSAGALDYVPFAALPVPGSADGLLLGEAFEIVRLPSASVLKAIRDESSPARHGERHSVAIVADPVFEASDPRAQRSAAGAGGPHQPATDAPPGPAGGTLTRLLFTRREADAIASLAPPGEAQEITGFDANRSAVLDGSLDGYRILHFATHGILNDVRPALSGLALSLVNERGEPQDGYVRLHDIYNLHVDADLVVLSACQTALGKQIRGEGLVGLARAFMYAGAPRVVATLWEVNDVATAELMKRFYTSLLHDGLPPAAALHAAQVSMSKQPRWRSPYYWAGFVLQGEWR